MVEVVVDHTWEQSASVAVVVAAVDVDGDDEEDAHADCIADVDEAQDSHIAADHGGHSIDGHRHGDVGHLLWRLL